MEFKYIVVSGGIRLGVIQAKNDKDFLEKIERPNFYLPLLFNVYTDNPFTQYGKLKDIPPAPLKVLASKRWNHPTTTPLQQ